MKIVSAIDYGFRKVVRVLLNDTDPQWVHEDAAGKRTPAPAGHTGNTDEGKKACLDCRNNWDDSNIFTAQFDGEVLLKQVEISPFIEAIEATDDNEAVPAQPVVFEMQAKTDAEIIAEVLERAEASVPQVPRDMAIR